MFSYDVIDNFQCEKEMNNILEDGVYNFEVKTAKQRVSKSGNQMIALTLTVYSDSDASRHTIFDNLLATPRWRWKIRKFCDSVGLIKEYESKTFDETLCEGMSGKCRIGTTIFNGKQQNSVEDYLGSNAEVTQKSKPLTNDEPFEDDEIPF
jgi:hypothetical protein